MLDWETFTLRRTGAILGRYPIVIVGPETMDLGAYVSAVPRASVMRFPDGCFSSRDAYNRLVVTSRFYEAFADWEFILIHQLDAFVFGDHLSDWCAAGYDYVGAPFTAGFGTMPGGGLIAGCNGGLCLRRVAAFLRVLASRSRVPIGAPWRPDHDRPAGWHALVRAARRMRHAASRRVGVETYLRLADYGGCDLFWSWDAPQFDRSFRVAPPAASVMFSFEMDLEHIGHHYQQRPPFGCHGEWNVRCAYETLELGLTPAGVYNAHLASILRLAAPARVYDGNGGGDRSDMVDR